MHRKDNKKQGQNFGKHGSRKSAFKGKRREDKGGRPRRERKPSSQTRSLESYTPVSWSPKGEAVYMQGSRRMLLWGGIPKEKAFYRSIHRGQNQSLLEFAYSKQPHVERIEATCKHYDRCGGCPFMHMTPKGQHEAKLQLLRSHLQEHGLEEYTPDHMHMGDDRFFRHQVKLVVSEEEGKMIIGVRNRRNRLVPIPDCEVITPTLQSITKKLAHKLIYRSKKPFDQKLFAYSSENQVGLRYIVARQSMTTGDVHLCFVATHPKHDYDELATWLISGKFPVTGVSLHINQEEGNAIFARTESGFIRSEVLRGERTLTETINGLSYQIGVGDFFQVNPPIAAQLQTDLLQHAQRFSKKPMVDLYCGVGFFSLALAKKFGHVLGIEGISSAIRRAKDNSLENKCKSDFFSGQVEDIIDRHFERLLHPFVVVDPARRGLEESVVQKLHHYAPSAIAYISCSPRSFADDVSKFLSLGWRVTSIQAYDMIPNSAHIEIFAMLEPSAGHLQQYRKPLRKVVR